MKTFICYERCSTCKKTQKWPDAKGVKKEELKKKLKSDGCEDNICIYCNYYYADNR